MKFTYVTYYRVEPPNKGHIGDHIIINLFCPLKRGCPFLEVLGVMKQ